MVLAPPHHEQLRCGRVAFLEGNERHISTQVAVGLTPSPEATRLSSVCGSPTSRTRGGVSPRSCNAVICRSINPGVMSCAKRRSGSLASSRRESRARFANGWSSLDFKDPSVAINPTDPNDIVIATSGSGPAVRQQLRPRLGCPGRPRRIHHRSSGIGEGRNRRGARRNDPRDLCGVRAVLWPRRVRCPFARSRRELEPADENQRRPLQ